jgi:hypothetical protein
MLAPVGYRRLRSPKEIRIMRTAKRFSVRLLPTQLRKLGRLRDEVRIITC